MKAKRQLEQLGPAIYRRPGHTMPLAEALSRCDKFLAAWLKVCVPGYRWFRDGDWEFYLEPRSVGDFVARIHARHVKEVRDAEE